eukprot:9129210-Pyramimonas_sp.AAC.1
MNEGTGLTARRLLKATLAAPKMAREAPQTPQRAPIPSRWGKNFEGWGSRGWQKLAFNALACPPPLDVPRRARAGPRFPPKRPQKCPGRLRGS